MVAFLAGGVIVLGAALGINVLGNAMGFFPSPVGPAKTLRIWKMRQLEHAVTEGNSPQVLILGSKPAYADPAGLC